MNNYFESRLKAVEDRMDKMSLGYMDLTRAITRTQLAAEALDETKAELIIQIEALSTFLKKQGIIA